MFIVSNITVFYFSPKSIEDFNLGSLAVCPLNTNKNADNETKSIPKLDYNLNDDLHDLTVNDPCEIFYNECLNNLNICHNLYECSTDIFHSLVFINGLTYFLPMGYNVKKKLFD